MFFGFVAELLEKIVGRYEYVKKVDYPDDAKKLEYLLLHVPISETMRILKRSSHESSALLEWAAFKGDATLITTVLSSLPPSRRLEVLLSTSYTPLHFAATKGDTKSVEALLSLLTPGQQLELMEQKSNQFTAFEYATKSGNSDVVCLLEFIRQRAEKHLSTDIEITGEAYYI